MKQRFKKYFENMIEILSRKEMTILPGHLAYYFVLSLVPTITIISVFASLFHLKIDEITGFLSVTNGTGLLELLRPTITNVNFNSTMLILLVVGTYIASNGMNSVILCANDIFGIEQNDPIKRRIKAIIMILIIIVLFLVLLIIPIFGEYILGFIEYLTGYNKIYDILNQLTKPFTFVVIFIFIKIIYCIAPDKSIKSSHTTLGALFTSAGWVLSTMVYSFYVRSFAHYSVYYSSLSNIAVLMIWIYLLAYIFVIGLAINYKEEYKRKDIDEEKDNIKKTLKIVIDGTGEQEK